MDSWVGDDFASGTDASQAIDGSISLLNCEESGANDADKCAIKPTDKDMLPHESQTVVSWIMDDYLISYVRLLLN